MDHEEKLTASEYYNLPLKELADHPDFDSKAYEKCVRFMTLTTEEIEKLDIPIKGE